MTATPQSPVLPRTAVRIGLALSLMLLIGAGLLIRSFTRLQDVSPGFATDRVLTMRVTATGPTYREDAQVAEFYREIVNRISHLPGVVATGTVSTLPLTGAVGWGGIKVEGFTPPPGQETMNGVEMPPS